MSVSFTAAVILAQNGMTESDFTDENVEYMMDDAIDTVNLLFGQEIAALTGDAGAKAASMTRAQSSVVKMLLSLVLRENKKTSLSNSSSTGSSTGGSSSISVGSVNVSESSSVSSSISAASAINNPANTIYVNMFMQAGKRLEVETAGLPICIGTDTGE